MCKFFSLTSDGRGNIAYFDNAIRKKIRSGELSYNADSHTSINDFYGWKGVDEDSRNKYEYNPLTKVFTIDMINGLDDSKVVKKKVKALDFSLIVPELIIKPIINPFKIVSQPLTSRNKSDLKKWASVWASVRASVGDSVGYSVRARDSVRDSVGDSVGDSVRDSVWDSVWDSVGYSVWDSVGYSVWDSVWDSVWAYTSSFFDIKHEHDFSSCVRLWEAGFVPVFYDSTWKLFAGNPAKVVYTMKCN